ncbi:MAG: RsbRD N-terminal domain-containing protein [Thermodesulfobacteriota bacterium]|nr:RsbRD N-terminal domain-containing protein [Thermodesulfobacteriota bacterium]
MTGLDKRIAGKKKEILGAWFERVSETYQDQTRSFLNKGGDRFANPVAGIVSESLEKTLDGLLGGVGSESLSRYMDPLMRVRAVQGFSPSASLAFVFSLKSILRDLLHIQGPEADQMALMDKRIDGLALICFDKFMECREKIYELKACEVRNRTFKAFERAGLIVDPEAAEPRA